MPEQIKPSQMHFYEASNKPYVIYMYIYASWHPREMRCCGSNLFWDGCNEIQILGP